MSTALAILPRVWACRQIEEVPSPEPRSEATQPLKPQLAFYRKYTEAMLRRYMRLSMEAGRAPSLLGREMFRGKVTSYRVHSFEDVVIFVHDVEQCLSRLDRKQQLYILRIAVQEYTQAETAELMQLSLRTVIRRYNQAIDRLTAIFLEVKLLEPLRLVKRQESPVED